MGGGVFSHSQVVENCSDIASELLHFLGNAGYAFGFDQGNGKTAEACYVFGTIVGAYPPSILIIIPVDDIVAAVLDSPVVVFNGMCEAQTSQWSLLFPLERHGLIKVIAPATGTAIPLFRLLLQLRFREAGPECIETMLRYIYYSRGKAEWHDFIEIMHRSDPIIEQAAVTTIAEHLVEKGRVSEAHQVLQKLLEERVGCVSSLPAEKPANPRPRCSAKAQTSAKGLFVIECI